MGDLIEVEESSFNKFLIVGNKYSNYKLIEKLLLENGIKEASRLKTENIKPKSISKIVLKLNDFKKSKKFAINPIWQGLAMDLILSNRNKDYWLWSDRNAIDLLDFWKSTDSTIAFVLVYSTPEYFIKKIIEKSKKSLTKEILDNEINKWILYNRKILNFYYRNMNSCILVNSDQVSQNSLEYLENLKKQMLIKDMNINNSDFSENENKEHFNEDKIYNYLVEKLVKENDSLINIYQEIQSCANFPFNELSIKNSSSLELLNSYLLNDKKYKESEEKINSLKKELELNKRIEASKLESKKEKELKEENELLLTQLFSVQEELEKYYLENQELKTKSKRNTPKRYYGAADRIKSQLSYRLGAKMIEESKSFSGVLSLPFTLKREVKKFRQNQKDKKKLPPIHTYADAYEAEKVKKHLSYKLGYEMIECFKSPFGIVKWPWAITKARKEYKESR